MNIHLGNNVSIDSLKDRISNYNQTIKAYHQGLGIGEREYRLAIVKKDCLIAQKQYLEYLFTKNQSSPCKSVMA